MSQIIGAYKCNTEKDLIDCQKHLIKKGYYWYSKSVHKKYGSSKPYYTNDEFSDRKIPNIYQPIIITLYDDKTLGWRLDAYEVINILQVFDQRKEELKRILDEI